MMRDIAMTIATGVVAFGLMSVHRRIDKVSVIAGFQYLTALLSFIPLIVVAAWAAMLHDIAEVPDLTLMLIALAISMVASMISVILALISARKERKRKECTMRL